MPTISLCMIVKNEEDCLERCLNSVKDLVDEIIIVDTGSTDKTKEIAGKFTDKIFDFRWVDDFSAARNESLKHATSEWILVLDADEVISVRDHGGIRSAISAEGYVAYSMVQRNYCDDSSLPNWVSGNGDSYLESKCAYGWDPNPVFRLFKNCVGIFYESRVHECVDKQVTLAGKFLILNAPIHHLGYSNIDKKKEKLLFYKGLCEKKINDNQMDFKARFEMASFYYNSGDFLCAINFLEDVIQINPDLNGCMEMLGTCYLRLNQFNKAKKIFQEAFDKGVVSSWLCSGMALVNINDKDFTLAIDNLIKAVELNPKNALYHFSLAQVFSIMGDNEKSYLAIKNAISLNPGLKNLVEIGG